MKKIFFTTVVLSVMFAFASVTFGQSQVWGQVTNIYGNYISNAQVRAYSLGSPTENCAIPFGAYWVVGTSSFGYYVFDTIDPFCDWVIVVETPTGYTWNPPNRYILHTEMVRVYYNIDFQGTPPN